jgi:hypothetical protein
MKIDMTCMIMMIEEEVLCRMRIVIRLWPEIACKVSWMVKNFRARTPHPAAATINPLLT